MIRGLPVGDFVQLLGLGLELIETHRFLRDVQTLVDSSFPEGVLFDGAADGQALKPFLIVLDMRNPSFRRYDLSKRREWEKKAYVQFELAICE